MERLFSAGFCGVAVIGHLFLLMGLVGQAWGSCSERYVTCHVTLYSANAFLVVEPRNSTAACQEFVNYFRCMGEGQTCVPSDPDYQRHIGQYEQNYTRECASLSGSIEQPSDGCSANLTICFNIISAVSTGGTTDVITYCTALMQALNCSQTRLTGCTDVNTVQFVSSLQTAYKQACPDLAGVSCPGALNCIVAAAQTAPSAALATYDVLRTCDTIDSMTDCLHSQCNASVTTPYSFRDIRLSFQQSCAVLKQKRAISQCDEFVKCAGNFSAPSDFEDAAATFVNTTFWCRMLLWFQGCVLEKSDVCGVAGDEQLASFTRNAQALSLSRCGPPPVTTTESTPVSTAFTGFDSAPTEGGEVGNDDVTSASPVTSSTPRGGAGGRRAGGREANTVRDADSSGWSPRPSEFLVTFILCLGLLAR